MKKIALIVVLFCLLLTPFLVKAQTSEGLVPCNGPDCSICSFFQLLTNIYSFIVWNIATPLAVLSLTIGGILILVSAGNPNLAGKGKTIFFAAIIGLVLVFGSYLVIDFVLNTIGYTHSWASLNFNCQ